jgi:acetolactate synthase-1/2/3 large subunit
VKLVRDGLGPYAALVDAVQAAAGGDFVWVRDVTVSNSTWGNRALRIHGPRDGVHALGGGIGQGLPMGIGAALAAGGRRTFILCGDGGLQLSLAELSTFAQERPDAVLIVMNDGGYGVIKNIQDAIYGGRRHCVEIGTPDFGALAQAIGFPHRRVTRVEDAAAALAGSGPVMVEIDMHAIGPFAAAFAGPPVRKAEPVKV